MSTKIKINGRVILNENRGYLRYISDKSETGKYLVGIELDKPVENGTDGTYNNIRYFTCPQGYGIFQEIDDVSVLQNSFLKAIEYSYIKGYVDDNDVISIVPTEREGTVSLILGKIGGKDIEFLSNDHQEYKVKSNENFHDDLKPSKYCRCITISSFNIKYIEDDDNLYQNFSHFFDATEIDLSDNLIESWNDIEKILKKFKCLEILRLSKNPINPEFNCTTNIYENLKSISLNYTSFKWETILKLRNQIPNIEEIYLCYDDIEKIPDTINGEAINFDQNFLKLKYVNLEGNKIEQWENLKGLSKIKSLQKLVLSYNNISRINYNSEEFQNLKSLSLNGCPITEWTEIEKLNEFRELNELYVKKIGLLSKCNNYENILRLNIISILFNLKKINGGDITKKEREDSERYYYTQFLRTHPNLDLESLKKMDNTFKRLFHKYEDIIVSMYNKMNSIPSAQPKSSTFIKVSFRNEDSTLKFEKKLPKTTTISKLRILASKLFKCDIQDLSIYVDEPQIEEEQLQKIESNVDIIGDYSNSDTLSLLCTW